jgi:choline kinase
VDTAWLNRYAHRTHHPPDDAEKVTVRNGVVTRIHRVIPESDAHGEYTGVARFSVEGASRLQQHFRQCQQKYADQPFREAKTFKKAYLIHLFQDLIEAGERMVHVDSPGGYIEVDTQQDFEYAQAHWS